MKDVIDRSFKYVMQDTSKMYVGGRLTYEEMISFEDVPFKIKSIANREWIPAAGREDITIEDHFRIMEKNSFIFQIFKTLKTKVKVHLPVVKEGKTGRFVSYKSKILGPEEYWELLHEESEPLLDENGQEIKPVTEEISFSKLAVMVFH